MEELKGYLGGLVPVALNVGKEALEEAFGNSASGEFNVLEGFVQDENQSVLQIEKTKTNQVVLSLEVSYSPGGATAVVMKAKRGALVASRPISEQVQFAVLCNHSIAKDEPAEEGSGETAAATTSSSKKSKDDESETLSNLYSYLHFGFSPLLRSYATVKARSPALEGEREDGAGNETPTPNEQQQQQQQQGSDQPEISEALKQALPLITKRMNELEYAMRSCLQSMEIPEVKLQIDNVVVDAVLKRNAAGKDLSLDELGLGEDVRDAQMLNRLQAGVNRWVREIQKVTKLDRDAGSGSVSQEVQFWHNMERALQQIQRQVDGPEVRFTLDILKQSRRALATILFENDTGLQVAKKRVNNYMILMQDFPIAALLSAADISQIEEAIIAIFSHLKKIKSADEYPLLQALRLVESLSRDMTAQLISVLTAKSLVQISYHEFEETMQDCESLFRSWDDNVRQFRELVRDLNKRRGGERLPPKLTYEHAALQERIEAFTAFRTSHEKLREVMEQVIETGEEQKMQQQQQQGDENKMDSSNTTAEGNNNNDQEEEQVKSKPSSTLGEINAAYQLFAAVDVLDVSRDGTLAFEEAKKLYERKIDRVERRIIENLTDKLGAAKTADEMFRVFSKFNALFFRHRIRGAIQQFQTRLIGTVEADIERLQRIFKKSYSQSQASVMSRVKDVPPVSGAIIWARQIERQLDTYLKRVEDVLGSGWEQHLEGRRLKETGTAFKKKLNTQQMFEQWMKNIQGVPSFEVTGRLFCVEEKKGDNASGLRLIVNFDPQIVELFKEVRNLQWLGFRIPYTLKIISDEAKEKYPYAMSLKSTLETYTMTVAQLDEELQSLLSSYIYDAQYSIDSSFNKSKGVHWDSDGLREYTSDFSQRVYVLQNKVDDAMDKSNEIQKYLLELKSCPYTTDAFSSALESIQKIVDEMNLASYSHLDEWVQKLEKRIDAILLGRLENGVQEWLDRFQDSKKLDRSSFHEVIVRKQALYLDPPLEEARVMWIRSLHDCIDIVCGLPRIQSSRYDTLAATSSTMEEVENNQNQRATFANLLAKQEDEQAITANELLSQAYASIEKVMATVQEYAMTWLQYQALWDMEANLIYDKVGEDLDMWQRLLVDIQKSRSTFDTAENSKSFGPVTVNYQQVQAQVSLRYDAWQKEILTKFGVILGTEMQAFFQKISGLRDSLENGSLDASTNEVVTFIMLIKSIHNEKPSLEEKLDLFAKGERLAQRQRMTFPPNWVWAANIQGEWDAFEQILDRKTKAMEAELPNLQSKIIVEDRAVGDRISTLVQDWQNEKPTGGSFQPADALNILAVFQGRVTRLTEEWNRIDAAKEALNLKDASSIGTGASNDILETTQSEITSLNEVWSSLSSVSGSILELKELPWTAVVPKKLRASLDGILEKLRALPSRVRQYEAFEFIQGQINDFKKSQSLIVELRSEALKDRHWRQIVKILSLENHSLKDLTLGDLWKSNLGKFQKPLSDIFRTAQGEMGLEEFLRQIRDVWNNYEFDLVNFQNRCRLIRGWDELFSQLDEHTNSLMSMKQSPYFKVFEEDASSWEDKLLRIRVVLDIWIDVQRRWVYLGGIFLGSADIKQQLPTEYSRFMSIDSEFIALMRKVSRTPKILEIISTMTNLDHSLQRLADLLEKIQKTLGEYLERQRQSFSRFYFVGDEDLLEIIGNTKDPVKIQRHLSKMFAGVAHLLFEKDEEQDMVHHAKAMISREGEQVEFDENLLVANVRVNDWLKNLEKTIESTLTKLLRKACSSNPLLQTTAAKEGDHDTFTQWIDQFPSQILILASQVAWSDNVAKQLKAKGSGEIMSKLEAQNVNWLSTLAERVLNGNLATDARKKHEQLITEMVHQRDVIRKLGATEQGDESYEWLSQLRYEWQSEQLVLRIASAQFNYGYEYQGVGERLVQTPLTDRCYLALTQALHFRLGGNPFGPAGTGKTESVKALGAQLGRFVLVFNCDEHFDLAAMGRIFVGLCQVGAWGCFDEFNRLEERILSAVSQQILNIQRGLLDHSKEIGLIGKTVTLNPNVGIFVTMNPGYAGRSNLPDNLKQLFRAIAMIEPDRELIAQVMLFSQGFKTAEKLAGKVVLLFKLCRDQLSEQPHYDFGLRAVKSVLLSAGNLKRGKSIQDQQEEEGKDSQERGITDEDFEQKLLIQSLCENVLPKLVSEDVALYKTLLGGVFPGADIVEAEAAALRKAVLEVCEARCFVPGERWISKVLQLEQVQQIRHGIMMVGPSGSGKTSSWSVLLEAMEKVDGIKGQAHVIDPKALSKEGLYGSLDPNTLEWTNGIFTHILRTILNNVRGEKSRRHWIIFDGDVDPEWAENLNSVLDDNKLLTLPNGERLSIPDNVRIMFEVETLKYATLATVSRCGMIWYSEDTLSLDEIFENRIRLMVDPTNQNNSNMLETREELEMCVEIIKPFLQHDNIVQDILRESIGMDHVMDCTRMRLIVSLFSLLKRGITMVSEYNQNRPDFPMNSDHLQKFLSKWVLFSLLWGTGGSLGTNERVELAEAVCKRTTVPLPSTLASDNSVTLWDFEVNIEDGEWRSWTQSVPKVDIEPHKVMDTDVVISTVDTVRHAQVLKAWLDEHRPLILCGPPGSGKTMSLTNVLQSMPNFELASLNFSSATTPELILDTFEQYCVYKPTRTGVVLAPPQPDRWLVVFCDEVNLPVADNYGTQHVITFLRQIIEQGGFWRPRDLNWVSVERIQFVSACNPPTDPGRVPLSHRFLRHTPLLLVDYPVRDSLRQIYGTFNRALLKLTPSLRAHADPLTEAMVDVFFSNKTRFSADVAPHYVYSPRELTRWMRALYEALEGHMESASLEQLVRLWLHEGLRLFHDRLVSPEEREWCSNHLDQVARERFPTCDHHVALARPILFANWLSKNYVSVEQEELRKHVASRLHVFYEEELNVPLVVFDDVLEHVLRIDRVLRQPLGHLLLVGKSGAGKTVLSRFVAWTNGLRVFQIKLSRKYSLDDFDEDLRYIMKQAGCIGEKVCFIFDESNVLESAFLERMNALLASGEVPGLFEGDEHHALMSACRDSMPDITEEEELFKEFTRNVQRNLHVVFTMNPASSDMKNRAATSPALFNRCVVDWFGDWSMQALGQVGFEFTRNLDIDSSKPGYRPPSTEASDIIEILHRTTTGGVGELGEFKYRDAVVTCLVHMHQSVQEVAKVQAKRHENHTFVSPRDYLDLINHYVDLFNKQRERLEEQQLHLNIGLDKLKETAEQVEELKKSLVLKEQELEQKNSEANAKLQQMVSDQNEAEKKKAEAEKMGQDLDARNAHVAEQKGIAEAELSKAEPALIDAQNAVSNIRKAHLDEMRALNNPPAAVKMTLEAVCVMLGLKFAGWTDIRKILQKKEFIPDVVNFKSEDLTEEQRANVMKMLENPDFTEDKVYNANKACVALFKWIVSQLEFAGILLRIQPLRDEIAKLAEESVTLTERHAEEMKKIEELETQIARLKEEYAVLIRETETIKSEMTSVKTKVERSTALLESLSQENERWSDAKVNFAEEMSTLVGDVLLAAGFITYCGFFGFKQRRKFFNEWKDLLDKLGVSYKKGISLVEYLSTPAQRMSWFGNGLANDNLSMENAIMLENFNRFPLVVDPSGQALEFLMKHLESRKVVKTSFLDASFMKQLESALRFGTCLVITDVEHIDPILNPVLNREIQRTGGRMLVRLGDQDIDFSPSFSMYLTTRDSTFQFAPDVCSRVTFVNFTVTPASLQSQCLSKVLKSERPDIDKQREDLLKLQGEYQARLRELEEKLLDSLNEAKGNILDDDSVVKTLESLKTEAKDINNKAKEAETVMEKVEKESAYFTPFAKKCSKAYFAMEGLDQIHFTYHFSLGFFFKILDEVLSSAKNSQSKDLELSFFKEMFLRVRAALLEKDELVWGLILARIFQDNKENVDLKALDILANQGNTMEEKTVDDLVPLSDGYKPHLKNKDDVFTKDIAMAMEPETTFLAASPMKDGTNATNQMLYTAILMSYHRPDRLLASLSRFINSVFGEAFTEARENAVLDLEKTIKETNPRHPILLLSSSQGFDMSNKVDLLASSLNIPIRAVAMGSAEGYKEAEKAISSATQSGGWVLLKNVHLASEWLQTLEKKMFNLSARGDFRLILTAEMNDKLPKTLLRQSMKVMFEAPKGVRASLARSLQAMPAERMNRAPVERSRLYLLLAWFHAMVMERLRFSPIGWSKSYEFSNADQTCAMNVIDEWIDRVSKGREHIAPEEIPWNAIRSILGESTYGGRIDNVFDQQILDSILKQLFVPKAFDIDFAFIKDEEFVLNAPEGTNKAQFEAWVSKLPTSNDPSWLGLSKSAEHILLKASGRKFLQEYLALHSEIVDLEDEEDDEETSAVAQIAVVEEEEDENEISAERPKWMSKVQVDVEKWVLDINQRKSEVTQLCKDKLKRTPETVSNPIFRSFEREASVVQRLMETLASQLQGLTRVFEGKQRMTNELLDLAHAIHRKEIPRVWAQSLSFGSKGVTVDLWFDDFIHKVNAFNMVLKKTNPFQLPLSMELGSLFSPGAFLTATRQQVAKSNGVSLDDLILVVKETASKEDGDASSFTSEVVMEGGKDQSRQVITCTFSWMQAAKEDNDAVINLPLYADASRQHLLSEAKFHGQVGPNHVLRGVALIAHLTI